MIDIIIKPVHQELQLVSSEVDWAQVISFLVSYTRISIALFINNIDDKGNNQLTLLGDQLDI